MLETIECYQLGTYNVPKSFKDKLTTVNLNSGPRLPRDGLGEQTYTGHFPVDISLNLQKGFYEVFNETVANHIAPILDEAHQIALDMIEKVLPGYVIVRGGLAALVSPGVQPFHRDPRVFHRFCKRVHLPVITNPGAALVIGDKKYHLPENTVWTFDNLTEIHRSENLGLETRYHILVDVIPRDRLEFVLTHITSSEMYSFWDQWPRKEDIKLMRILGI